MASWDDWITALIGGAGAYAGAQAGGPQTTTQTTQMPPEMMGQWKAYADFANQVANRPYQSGVAPMSQDQYQAMDMVRNAAGGTPEMQAGSQALQGFLGGGQQNPFMGMDNPYLKGIIQNTNDEVQNRMGTAAFSSGSFGNSGVANQTAKALADSTNALQYGQYMNSANLAENALNRTTSMIPQALNYQNQYFNNASQQLQTGAMQQAQGQNMLTDYLNYPQKQLNTMGQPLNFNTGATTTQSVPGNTTASAIGGGLLGLKIGDLWNQWGKTA
jgi:hypothetical protein